MRRQEFNCELVHHVQALLLGTTRQHAATNLEGVVLLELAEHPRSHSPFQSRDGSQRHQITIRCANFQTQQFIRVRPAFLLDHRDHPVGLAVQIEAVDVIRR